MFPNFTASLVLSLALLTPQLSAAPPHHERAVKTQDVTVQDDYIGSGYKNMVYFVNWAIYARNYQPQQLPESKITHVLYSFQNLAEDGTVYVPSCLTACPEGKSFGSRLRPYYSTLSDTFSDLEKHYPNDSWSESGVNMYGCLKQLYILKKRNRAIKTLMSVGGWTYSTHFGAATSTSTTRAKFAANCVQFVKDLGFDGVDIDWEYPADDTEAANFVLLLAELRRQLDEYAATNAPGYHFLITVAAPAGSSKYQKLHLTEMNSYIDTWNLMAYDYSGAWDTRSGHNANLYPSKIQPSSTPFDTDRAITDYVNAGIPAKKINLGIPLYGRAFVGTAGPGEPYTSVGEGSWEKGIWDYRVLPKAGSTIMTDETAGATYSYDNSTQTMISFDTVDMVRKKVEYIRGQGLGGAMFWEASGDKTGDESLISTTASGFSDLDTSSNWLTYAASKYNNMANGMPEV